MEWLPIAASLLGGVGLLLLGMRLMSEGLRVAAGTALRTLLERWTGTRIKALLAGVFITSLVQSSSAVTVAVIGFANAGLLTLGQAVAVIYGSNVGTTVTGWLVALVGLNVDVKAFALPGIGIGMALRLAVARRRLGAFGEALAGFGVFFLGIDVLKSSLGGLQDGLPVSSLASLAITGAGGVLLFTLIGFALTLLMQSSSAALAVILSSVGSEVIPIEAGACLVIGANIGTTSTAAIAVIGATSNAKRVAMAHVAFNVATGTVALAALPLLLLVVGRFREALGLQSEPAAVVAGFHTLFNLLGVALMWPLTNRLVRALEQRFLTREEEEGRPRYLDRNVLSTPVLAANALGLELARAGAMAREMAQTSLQARAQRTRLPSRRASLNQLVFEIGEFVSELQHLRISVELAPAMPMALRVLRHHAEVAELAEAIAVSDDTIEPLRHDLAQQVRGFEAGVSSVLDAAAVDLPGTSAEAAKQRLDELQNDYHRLKEALLEAGAGGRVSVGQLVAQLDRLSNLRRMAEQMEHGARYLWQLGSLAAGEHAATRGSVPLDAGDAANGAPVPSTGTPGRGKSTNAGTGMETP